MPRITKTKAKPKRRRAAPTIKIIGSIEPGSSVTIVEATNFPEPRSSAALLPANDFIPPRQS